MKILVKSLLLAVAVGLTSAVAQAETQTKIAVVDVNKAFQSFFGLKERAEKVKALQQRAQEELDRRLKELNAASDKYKELIEQTKSPILKEDARAAAEKDAEKQLEDLKKLDGTVKQWYQEAQQTIAQADEQLKLEVVNIIRTSAGEIVKKRGSTILFDRSALSAAGLQVILAFDSSTDITDDVIADINKGLKAPTADAAPAAAAPAVAAPATAPAPATEGSPAVSFPGVKK